MPVLKRVPVQWASVQKPNTQFEPAWEVQATLTKEQASELLAEAKKIHPKGIKIKKEDDGTLTFRFKRSVERKDGKGENSPPACVGPNKDVPFTKQIGNGSICNIQYSLVPWNNKFGSGITTDFKGIQVLEHVPYGVQDGEEFDNESDEPASLDEEAPFDSAGFDDDF